MSKLKLYIISANLLVILGFFFVKIVQNEHVLNSGEVVLMELRPVDPRSIMQGDYMTLRFNIGDSVRTGNFEDEYGEVIYNNYQEYKYCVVRLDQDKVASYVRLTNDEKDLQEGEMLLRFSSGKSRWEHYVYFGADSYFFQEGTGSKYAGARYGMLKVVTEGNMIGTCNLVGLCGEDKKLIE